ncbi:MAG: hypothetical protein J3Q66DRAFT_382890 [Benniella sp.]|nr:MAG: hypothetical protein J3Q66DRAFT_382890 [Benniella sp.]
MCVSSGRGRQEATGSSGTALCKLQTDYVPSTVQVTGEYDDWRKSDTGFLTKNERSRQFEGAISIDLDRLREIAQEKKKQQRKLVYKFCAERTELDPSQETEWDYSGNLNNVRLVDDVPLNNTTFKTAADRKKDQHHHHHYHQQQQCRDRAASDSTTKDAFDHVMSSASASTSMESVASTASVTCDPPTTASLGKSAAVAAVPVSTLDGPHKTQLTSNNSGRKKKGKGSGF